VWEDEQFFEALKRVGANFEKIAEMIGTRNKSQVRAFHNAEVKKINAVLAPLGVQVDPLDAEEVHTAMESWHSMKDRLLSSSGTAKGSAGKRDTERNRLAWEFKNELEKSVWTEGKKRAKLRALGVLGADNEDVSRLVSGGVLGVVDNAGALGPTKVKRSTRGRPKGSKNGAGGKGKARGSPGGVSGALRDEGGAGRLDRKARSDRKSSWGFSGSRKHGHDGCDDPNGPNGKARLLLQLFAVDETTKNALIAAGLNPHLELTFRAKKSVPGLMRHLALKWAAAVAELPKTTRDAEPTLQLYPFESASAEEAPGAWNASHDGATATDIFDACGRPAMFRARYGWVSARKAAARPYLAPPPPPVHQQSVLGIAFDRNRSRSRSATPPQNLSPRKRAADEMDLRHVAGAVAGDGEAPDSFCREPVVSGGGFGGAFGFEFGLGGGSIFGNDLAFGTAGLGKDGGMVSSSGPGTTSSSLDAPRGFVVPGAVRPRADGSSRGVVPGSGDFTLSGFPDHGEFSAMCREMGLEDPSRIEASADACGGGTRGRPGSPNGEARFALEDARGNPASSEATALVSAAPEALSDRARREIIAEFAGDAAEVTVGGILEVDMFSLTQMLGDVPGETGDAERPGGGAHGDAGGQAAGGGPTSFAGMFGGSLADATDAKRPVG